MVERVRDNGDRRGWTGCKRRGRGTMEDKPAFRKLQATARMGVLRGSEQL